MSFEFPGTSGTKNVINSKEFVPTGDKLSVAVWMKPAANNAGGNGRFVWAHGNIGQERAKLFFLGSNKLTFMRQLSSGTQRWDMTTSMTDILSWRHVVVTHDPIRPKLPDSSKFDPDKPLPDPVLYIYKPGSPLSINKVGSGLKRVSAGTSLPRPDDKFFRLGNNSPTGNQPFKGLLASLTVWSDVLTEAEVRSVIYRGDRTIIKDIKFGWDLRIEPSVPPETDPMPDPIPIDDWTKTTGDVLGIPSGVKYLRDNPPRRVRIGPSIVTE